MMVWWDSKQEHQDCNDDEAIHIVVPTEHHHHHHHDHDDSKRQIVSEWQLLPTRHQLFSSFQNDTTIPQQTIIMNDDDDDDHKDSPTKMTLAHRCTTIFRARQDGSFSLPFQTSNANNNDDNDDDTMMAANKQKSSSSSSAAALNTLLDERNYQLKHIAAWPFGKVLSMLLMLCCILGLVFIILARRSLAYVHLQTPVELSPIYHRIDTVGLARVHVCVNETAVSTLLQTESMSEYPTENNNNKKKNNCDVYSLSRDIVNDTMWNVARACLGGSILLGACVTVVLFCTIWYWQTLNLKPICLALLVTYLLQSCTFFMYDSNLCRINHCQVGVGTAYNIMASVFWFVSTLVSIRMDINMTRAKRSLQRKRMRAIRRIERRKRRLLLERHNNTTTTSATDSSTSSNHNNSSERTTEMGDNYETPPSSPGGNTTKTVAADDDESTTSRTVNDSPISMSRLAYCLWNGTNRVGDFNDEDDDDDEDEEERHNHNQVHHGLYEA
jgi:hypothetical protein